jgi:hypothetical protein
MKNYKIFNLDKPQAKEYILECLRQGKILSHLVADSLKLSEGTVTTALPENGDPNNLYNFEYGGIVPEAPISEWKHVSDIKGNRSTLVPVHPITEYVTDTISAHLKANITHICLFEDAMAKPSDPGLDSLKSLKIITDNTIYHIITSPNNNLETINDTISSSMSISPPTMGFLTYPKKAFTVKNNQVVHSDIIHLMASNVNKIIVGAYDMEGYLIWEKAK